MKGTLSNKLKYCNYANENTFTHIDTSLYQYIVPLISLFTNDTYMFPQTQQNENNRMTN